LKKLGLSSSLPKVFQLEITNVCNYRCPYCPYGRGDYKPMARYLRKHEIERWLIRGDFDNTDRLEGLHVMGEPTLHPEFFDIVELFGDYGIPVLDATNASMFVHKWFVEKALKLKNLKVWIIGIDASTYEEWVKAKGTYGFPKKYWDKMIEGLDYYLRNVSNTKAIVRIIKSQWTGDIKLFKQYWGRYEEINPNVKVEVKFLDTFAGRYSWVRTRPTLKEAQGICPEPFRHVVILSNGDVVPCCYVYDSSIVYGNLFAQDLATIWQTSPVRQALIEDMVSKRYLFKPCSHCREWIIPSDVEVLDESWGGQDD